MLQVHNAGICNYLPYNGCTSKTKSDTYAARSSYSSSWGAAYYNAVFQTMTEEDFEWAKKTSDEYLKIRHYFTMDFYNHGSAAFDDTSWAIWQYHDYEKDCGVILAFRRSNSPFEKAEIQLKGVEKDGEYTFNCFDDAKVSAKGTAVTIGLAKKRSSTVIAYSRTAE